MRAFGKFILLDLNEFDDWLNLQEITREIRLVQHHHTLVPGYSDFNGLNHFQLCKSMENYHIQERGFKEIAQNFTTFPDGKICVCRNINTIPAGIKGANAFGICIENLGNFDKGKDKMGIEHKNTIISMTKSLLIRFSLAAGNQSVVYHHWYDQSLGKRLAEGERGDTKSCPGTNFFGGNKVSDFEINFLPLISP